jgi:putative Mn2+ efflux pump MntP
MTLQGSGRHRDKAFFVAGALLRVKMRCSFTGASAFYFLPIRYELIMGLWTVFLVAMALALDAFAVAFGAGFARRVVSLRQTFRLSFHFGIFQAMMNVCGWAAGLSFRRLIENVDHWIAFGLLCLVGINMIVGALKGRSDEAAADPSKGFTLVMLSVATSIDALAVGLSFSLLKIAITVPALIIGVVAAVMTVIGIRLGRFAGSFSRLGAQAEIFGGLVLMGIGVHILKSHGVF